MKNLKDKVAVITGAGSGIGRALAAGLAAKGCHIAISDVDDAGLAETANQLADAGVRVTTHSVDVADREQVYQHARDVAEAHGRVNLVINNAGVALGDALETAETTARIIIEGLQNNRQRVLIGSHARVLDWMTRLFPVFAKNIVAWGTCRLARQQAKAAAMLKGS